MIRIDGPIRQGWILLIILVLVLTSCGTRKILTDASDARGKTFKGSLTQRYATILEVREKDLKNERLYKFIDSWMGAPHRTGGIDKGGVDCSGFAIRLEKEVYHKDIPRTARQMAEAVKRKFEGELQEGDLVFFDFDGQKFSHVGVFLQNNKFVHVSTRRGVIISDLKDPWYYKSFSRAGSVIAR